MDTKKTGYKNLKLKCTLRAPITVYWVSCIRDEIYIWSQIGDQTKMGKLGTLTSQSPPTLGSSRPSAWSSTWSSHWNQQSNQKNGVPATQWSQSGLRGAHWPSGLNRPHSFLSWVFPLEKHRTLVRSEYIESLISWKTVFFRKHLTKLRK